MGNAKLYLGNDAVTPSTVQIVQVPEIPIGTVPFVVTNGYAHRGTTEGLNLTGVNYIQEYLYSNIYRNNVNIIGPAIINAPTILTGKNNMFYGAFTNCTNLRTTGLENVREIRGEDYQSGYICDAMFAGCSNLISTGLDNLTTISSSNACYQMFQGCTNLTTTNLTNATYLSGTYGMFQGCTNLRSAALSNVDTLAYCGSMFADCINLTDIGLENLTTISRANTCANMFINCTNLTSIGNAFSSLVNIYAYGTGSDYRQCMNMFTNTGIVHLNLSQVPTNITIHNSAAGTWAQGMFSRCINLTDIDLGNRTSLFLSGDGIFSGCYSLLSTGLANITSITATASNMYSSCTNLYDTQTENITSVLSSVQGMFWGCSNIKQASFKNLIEIGIYGNFVNMFRNCTNLIELKFSKLQSVINNNRIFDNMLYGTRNCKVYFPSAMENVIGNWSSVQGGFGGTNTSVIFNSGIELPVNIPSGYTVWVNDNDITDKASYDFLEGENIVIIKRDGGAGITPRLAKFTFIATSETTEFTFDPETLSYSQTTVDWVSLGDPTELYMTFKDNVTSLTIDLAPSLQSSPSELVEISPNLEVTFRGTCSGGYLVPVSFVSGTQNQLTLTFSRAHVLNYSANDLNTMFGNQDTVITQDNVEYLQLCNWSHGTSIYLNRLLTFDSSVLSGYSMIIIEGQAFTSTEQNYDFGYILFGNNTAYPTSNAQVKDKTEYNGNKYIFNSSGINTPVPFEAEQIIGADTWYLQLGYVSDTSQYQGTDSVYMSGLKITLIE